ncbi:ATP-binding protein [Streptosporangium saharense]|uniref:ATP-binding protein n=1 Tax=Streptosporangium saharense TaxID=1706840 RepID=UPI003679BE3D
MSAFVGRRDEVAEITALFGRVRLVTLSGAGGVGKTRLGLELARTLVPEPAVIDVAELAQVGGPQALAPAVTEALALSTGSLLVLDTCEALVDEVASLVSELLAADSELRVLAISRQSLAVPGEHLWVLSSLPAQDAHALLTGLGAPWPQETLTEVCDRLEGLPLAIELAAVRLRAMPAEDFVTALDDRLALLVDEDRQGPSRHRALATCIGWSHQLCTERERLFWARVSVFPGEFDLEAATYVCRDDTLRAQDMVDVVTGLVDKSVLLRRETVAGVRFLMPGATREFGAGWLALLGQQEEVRLRHHDFYLALARTAEHEWPRRQVRWHRRLRLEAANLAQALETGLEAGTGLELAGTLWILWVCCGMHAEGRGYLDRALAADLRRGPARTRALWVCAWTASLQGDLLGADERLSECREADPGGHAGAYVTQLAAQVAAQRGQADRAVLGIRAARDRHHSAGRSFPGLLPGYAVVATCLLTLGDVEAAIGVLVEGLDLCETYEDLWTRSHLCHLRAQADYLRGDLAAAGEHAREALRTARLFDDRTAQAAGIELLGALAVAERRAEEGLALLAAARDAWAALGGDHLRPPLLASIPAPQETLPTEVLSLDAATTLALKEP